MILTDDNFATIVHAVELGRGLYDNLTKYVRFQMGALVGLIVTFLGVSIFNIVGGVPFWQVARDRGTRQCFLARACPFAGHSRRLHLDAR